MFSSLFQGFTTKVSSLGGQWVHHTEKALEGSLFCQGVLSYRVVSILTDTMSDHSTSAVVLSVVPSCPLNQEQSLLFSELGGPPVHLSSNQEAVA